MKVSILSIGNELLMGKIANTNAALIAKDLTRLGLKISAIYMIQDEKGEIQKKLSLSLDESDCVIITGGLGPTLDDITRESVADFLNLKMALNEPLKIRLKEKFGEFKTLANQASVIAGAEILENPYGTAPGQLINLQSKKIFLLPGVPYEMAYLLEKEVLPRIKIKEAGGKEKTFFMTDLREGDVDPFLREFKSKYRTLSFGIYPKPGLLEIIAYDLPGGLREGEFEKVIQEINQKYKDYIYDSTNGLIEEGLQSLLKKKQLSLSLAESCTGGLASSKITSQRGASLVFKGSLIAYSNEIKEDLLNVPHETLQEKGAVSFETALAMAKNALLRFNSDIGASITGIAGPDGGTLDKPVGTIFMALAFKDSLPKVKKIQAFGSREMIREEGANRLLSFLYHTLKF
ncbi:CinA family nicotinamide mononucleotide deamidase-related protein [Criblamydia sequanensis]|uniref:CinA-like protein n=1 Tax=Candidatus Criblamydia sequanensis CRIB-18 TaxID=1437425 RepID=A0A090CZD4_9BACT|nr:CinA family nicotinamide mononucleotide deamidase-related protein [Criblamydia sequanensis]CDR34387.1 Competence-damage inducible protein [Criblamydia sequanensis CRIB-18]